MWTPCIIAFTIIYSILDILLKNSNLKKCKKKWVYFQVINQSVRFLRDTQWPYNELCPHQNLTKLLLNKTFYFRNVFIHFTLMELSLSFSIPLSLQHDVVHLKYFNLWILEDLITKIEISKGFTIRLERYRDYNIRFCGQKLSFFHIRNVL